MSVAHPGKATLALLHGQHGAITGRIAQKYQGYYVPRNGTVLPSARQNATIGKVLVEVGQFVPVDAGNRKPQGLPFTTSLVRNESLCSALLRKRCAMGVSNQVYTDQLITCVDCGQQFTFTAGEQEFYAQKGFQNKPSRCPDCRAARKASKGGGGGQRLMFRTTCSSCGGTAEVPFQPRGDKPVYCRDCFQNQRSSY